MRYITVILILALGVSSCQKTANSNASRGAMLGHYHFTSIDFNTGLSKKGFDTARYDGAVTIPYPDNGNGINITYPSATASSICQTADSAFVSIVYLCPNNSAPLSGSFRHDTLFMTDYSYGCENGDMSLYVSTIGIKY
jgi:hypothetical protein